MKICILPAEKYQLALSKLETARNSGHPLASAIYSLIYDLIQEANPATEADLVVGRQYAMMELHPFANAWRNGKLLINHGEIYAALYQYTPEGTFSCDSALGTTYVCKLCEDMLYIETLP